jgi:hypothetical protein
MKTIQRKFNTNEIVKLTTAPSINEYVIIAKVATPYGREPLYDVRNRATGQLFKTVKQSNIYR